MSTNLSVKRIGRVFRVRAPMQIGSMPAILPRHPGPVQALHRPWHLRSSSLLDLLGEGVKLTGVFDGGLSSFVPAGFETNFRQGVAGAIRLSTPEKVIALGEEIRSRSGRLRAWATFLATVAKEKPAQSSCRFERIRVKAWVQLRLRMMRRSE
jgi:hypothetical protein